MLIYGKQTVFYVIEHTPSLIEKIYIAKEIDKKEFSALHKLGCDIQRIPQAAAQKMAKSQNHQGYLCEVKPFNTLKFSEIKGLDFIVMLCGITDMGNIGALVRTSYALGADALIIGGIKNIAFEEIAKRSSGALFNTKVVAAENMLDSINELKQCGFTLYGAESGGEDVRKVDFSAKKVLLLGNESQGLSSRIRKSLDKVISIPMKNSFDSLNVSAAGAILIDRMRP